MKDKMSNKFPSPLIKRIINLWHSYLQAVHYANNGYPIYDVKDTTQCSAKNSKVDTIANGISL